MIGGLATDFQQLHRSPLHHRGIANRREKRLLADVTATRGRRQQSSRCDQIDRQLVEPSIGRERAHHRLLRRGKAGRIDDDQIKPLALGFGSSECRKRIFDEKLMRFRRQSREHKVAPRRVNGRFGSIHGDDVGSAAEGAAMEKPPV